LERFELDPMLILQYILAIIGFSLIVIVHEIGHFALAKAGGMFVQEFYIGFGPKLYSYKSKSGTEYGIRAIPLGGYVKVLGMDRNEKIPDGMEDRAFEKKPFVKKFLTIFSGAAFNAIFAVILIAIFLSMGVYEVTTTVDYIQPDSPASRSDILIGDEVVAVDGQEISKWEEFVLMTQDRPGEKVEYTLMRDGSEVRVEVTLDIVDGKGFLGVSPVYIKQTMGFFEILGESFHMTWEILVTYVKLFGQLFAGKIPLQEARPVSPIGLVSIFQQSIAMGTQNGFLFMALISVLLGFGNLLPILPLDGGNIVLLIIETIRKRPVPRKVVETANYLGIFLMASILIVGFVFDIISPINLSNL